MNNFFTLSQIVDNYNLIKPHMVKTPVITSQRLSKLTDATLHFKAELFQVTGTFKVRGALTLISDLNKTEIKNGLIAGTGGNHGAAVAYVSSLFDINAKIVVPRHINQFRLNLIKNHGATIEYVENMKHILSKMQQLAQDESRVIIHPFDHPLITLGAASLGYEFLQEVPDLDLLVIPIGGGGLASGVAHAAKLLNPNIQIIGIEPEKANSMYLSFDANEPIALKNGGESIADSLNAPCALPYSFSVCKQFIDEIVLVTDNQIKAAMKLLFQELKLACEPACAAATAALLGPLQTKIKGKKVGIILCGSNIDFETFKTLV